MNPANLTLKHGRKPLIRDALHGENLYDPFSSLLPIVGFILGKLGLSVIRERVELRGSAALTNAIQGRQDGRRYLRTRFIAKIRGVRRRCSTCKKGNV